MPKIKVDGIQLYYEIQGDGPTVLFLHGLGSSTRDWEFQVPAFARQYRVITVDMRWHGQSDKPPGPYSVRQFSEDVAAFIQALDLAPVHVVGLSMGGMIAYQLGVDHPELIRSLIIVNSAPSFKPRGLKEKLAAQQRLLLVRLFGMKKVGEVLAERMFPKPEQAPIREVFVQRWAENDRQAYLEATKAILNFDISDRIGAITAPTLIVSADDDYIPVAVKEADAARMPNARVVVIPDSRHGLPVEKPDEFNQVALDFLDELQQTDLSAPG